MPGRSTELLGPDCQLHRDGVGLHDALIPELISIATLAMEIAGSGQVLMFPSLCSTDDNPDLLRTDGWQVQACQDPDLNVPQRPGYNDLH